MYQWYSQTPWTKSGFTVTWRGAELDQNQIFQLCHENFDVVCKCTETGGGLCVCVCVCLATYEDVCMCITCVHMSVSNFQNVLPLGPRRRFHIVLIFHLFMIDWDRVDVPEHNVFNQRTYILLSCHLWSAHKTNLSHNIYSWIKQQKTTC